MKIHRLWPFRNLWWQKLAYPRRSVPLTEIGETQESGFPWRIGRCRVFRIPLTRHAVAVGRWTGYQPRETIEGQPTLTFRQLEHPEDYFHVQPSQERSASTGPDLRF